MFNFKIEINFFIYNKEIMNENNENNQNEENNIEETTYQWYEDLDYSELEQELTTGHHGGTGNTTGNFEFQITFENIFPNDTYNYYRPLQRRRLNPVNNNLTTFYNYPLLDRTLSSRINSTPLQFSPLRSYRSNNLNRNVPFSYTIEYDFSRIPQISEDRVDRIRTLFNNYFQENFVEDVINESFQTTEFLTKNDNVEIRKDFEMYKNIDEEIKQQYKSCTICTDEFEDDSKIQLLNCQHIYHHNCLTEWVKRKPDCPICRNPVKIYYKNGSENSGSNSENLENTSENTSEQNNNIHHENTDEQSYEELDEIFYIYESVISDIEDD
jgi:hypothetical protein